MVQRVEHTALIGHSNRGLVHMMEGATNPNAPNQKDKNGEGYKTGIFIHRTNWDGFAGVGSNGGAVSKGCLLISAKDWVRFTKIMGTTSPYKVQVIRTKDSEPQKPSGWIITF